MPKLPCGEVNRVQRLACLEVGQTASESQFFAFDDATRQDIKDWYRRITSSFTGAASRVTSKEPGRKFTVDSGDFRTVQMNLVATVAVTRIA